MRSHSNLRAYAVAFLVLFALVFSVAFTGLTVGAHDNNSAMAELAPTPDPYATPDPNPAPAQVRAQSITNPPGYFTFPNGTYTGPPVCRYLLIPSINPSTAVNLCAIVVRPPGGGGLHILTLYTNDGIQREIDLEQLYGFGDCFGGSPDWSPFSGTVKVEMNCKDDRDGNGNTRGRFSLDSGIVASPDPQR